MILVADADPAVCDLYRTVLGAKGFDTDDAFDGRDALARVFALHPSAIVLATGLTFIDGPELCRLLRGDRHTAGIRVVVVTETAEHADVARAWDAGADAVVDRRRALESLDEAVRSALTRARTARSSRATAVASTPSSRRASKMVHAHERFRTTLPPLAPPSLRCPSCDAHLAYDHSQVGGVNARFGEQWDYFVCATCGSFEFRQRTKHLRRTICL